MTKPGKLSAMPGLGIPAQMGGGPKPLSRVMFDKYDTIGKGHIDAKGFQHLCYDMGHYFDDDKITIAIREIDRDGNGTIEYAEFVDWWKKSDRFASLELDDDSLSLRRTAAEAFQRFDTDKSGSLDRAEFPAFYKHLVQAGLTKKPEAECLKDLDQDNDGKVQFNEYVDWLKRIGTLPQKTLLADKNVPLAQQNLKKH